MVQLKTFQQQQLCLTSFAAISGLTNLESPGQPDTTCRAPTHRCLHSPAQHCMLPAGPELTIMIYREICVPLLAADAHVLVARHNQVLEQVCQTVLMPSLSRLHPALCFQIIQAFSRIVAAGSMWSSAFLLLDEATFTLQSGLRPTESQSLVNIVWTKPTARISYLHCHTLRVSNWYICSAALCLRSCFWPHIL